MRSIGLMLWCVWFAGCEAVDPGDDDSAAFDFEADTGPDDGDTGLFELAPIRATIGPAGGTLSAPMDSLLAGAAVVVPPGALVEEVVLELRGVIDPTALAETASAIGPQIELLPAGLSFAVPVQVTAPFDPQLRRQWDTPDDECRVWARAGDGWANHEAIASDEDSVTVELDATTTFAAGVFRVPRPPACLFNCGSPAPPVANCLDGNFACLEQIGTQHVPFLREWSSYTQGVIYWITAPGSGELALAGFDVIDRQAIPTSGSIQLGSSPTTVGEVVAADDGSRWVGFLHRANVRFEEGRLGQPFDSFGTTASPRAIGVAFHQATREVVRVRAQGMPATAGQPPSQNVSTVVGGTAHTVLNVRSPNSLGGVLQIGRAASTSPTGSPLLTFGTAAGATFAPVRAPTGFAVQTPQNCGSGRTVKEVIAVAVRPARVGWAMLCKADDNTGAMLASNGSTAIATFAINQIPRGSMAVENDGTIWLADRLKAQLTRFGLDGSATLYPLSSAATSSPEYLAMLPLSVHYDSGLDTLYLVTAGVGAVRQFWAIDNLP